MTLQVSVDGVWRPCPEEGGRIEFPGFNGMMRSYAFLYVLELSFRVVIP